MQAKEVPGWLRRDTDLTGVEYIDTHSIKFHDRPLPNLSSQEKHRAGIWDDLGAESQRFSEEAYTLPIEARRGSGLCRMVISCHRDAWRKRETASAAPSPVLARILSSLQPIHSPSGVTGLVQRPIGR